MNPQEEVVAAMAAVAAYLEAEMGAARPIHRPSRWREAGRAELMEGCLLCLRRDVPFSRAIPSFSGRGGSRHG